MTERILCAAIWYKDVPTAAHTCKNTKKGTVLCGFGHAHIIMQMNALTGKRTVNNGDNAVGEFKQGFLTSKNRFVDREEGAEIARNAEQVPSHVTRLYSEDLLKEY